MTDPRIRSRYRTVAVYVDAAVVGVDAAVRARRHHRRVLDTRGPLRIRGDRLVGGGGKRDSRSSSPLVSVGAGNSVYVAAVFTVAAVLICVYGIVSPLASVSAPTGGGRERHRAAVVAVRRGLDATAEVAAGARQRGVVARASPSVGAKVMRSTVAPLASVPGYVDPVPTRRYSVRAMVIVKSTCALAVMLPVPVV